jgi:suppressor of ftsI
MTLKSRQSSAAASRRFIARIWIVGVYAADLGRAALQVLLFAVLAVTVTLMTHARTPRRPVVPELHSKNGVLDLTLHAVRDSAGHDQFSFNGRNLAPVLRVAPGDALKITYINDLPRPSGEQCSTGPCQNMTNLHFHGLGISPKAPQDDVLDMMAAPGETLHYAVAIPGDQPPGLYWYHTHPHGESEQQALDGMSGAIVVEGIDNYVPQVRGLPEKVLVLRGRSIEHDPNATDLVHRVSMSTGSCGPQPEKPERIFTVNGAIRPTINIAPGQREFWRIVNASSDRYLDLEVDRASWEIVALDGMPLGYHDPKNPVRTENHVLLPPASRLEAIVTGPAGNTPSMLRTRCVDAGPDGDSTPPMVLADLAPISSTVDKRTASAASGRPAIHRELDLKSLESGPPAFVATFTEDKAGFYINYKKYSPDADPMVRVRVGTMQHLASVQRHPRAAPHASSPGALSGLRAEWRAPGTSRVA